MGTKDFWIAVVMTTSLTTALAVVPGVARADLAASSVSPSRELSGATSQISDPSSVALDEAGNLYVANESANSVTVYSSTWSSFQTAPVKVLQGTSTQLVQPRAIAFDSSGQMYVVNSDRINVYGPGWASGNTAPTRILRGPNTGLVDPRGIAFDSGDRMYISNSYENVSYGSSQRVGSVSVFAASWAGGDTTPVAVLEGPETFLDRPYGIQFDVLGRMLVANRDSITAYAPGWSGGSQSPLGRLSGVATLLSRPTSVAVDEQGILFVSNLGTSSVTTYEVTWNGSVVNATPLSTLSGSETKLSQPMSLHVDDVGQVTVANSGTDSVTSYASSGLEVSVSHGDGPSFSLMHSSPGLSPPSFEFRADSVTVSAQTTLGASVRIVAVTPTTCEGEGHGQAILSFKRPGTCSVKVQLQIPEPWSVSPSLTRSFTISPSSQAISVAPIPSALISDRWQVVRPTATSGLPVTVLTQSPSVCRPTRAFGNRVRLLAEGACSLLLAQLGNPFWQQAVTSVSFPVVKATIQAQCQPATTAGRAFVKCQGLSRGLPPGTPLEVFTRAPRGPWTQRVPEERPQVDSTGTFTWSGAAGSGRSLSIYFASGSARSLPVSVKFR